MATEMGPLKGMELQQLEEDKEEIRRQCGRVRRSKRC